MGELEWACDERGTVLPSQAAVPGDCPASAEAAVAGSSNLTVADPVVFSSLKAAAWALTSWSKPARFRDRQWSGGHGPWRGQAGTITELEQVRQSGTRNRVPLMGPRGCRPGA